MKINTSRNFCIAIGKSDGIFPAVKHLESVKSTDEPVPPTLNEKGTVPEALSYDTETLFTVHDKEENVVNSFTSIKVTSGIANTISSQINRCLASYKFKHTRHNQGKRVSCVSGSAI